MKNSAHGSFKKSDTLLPQIPGVSNPLVRTSLLSRLNSYLHNSWVRNSLDQLLVTGSRNSSTTVCRPRWISNQLSTNVSMNRWKSIQEDPWRGHIMWFARMTLHEPTWNSSNARPRDLSFLPHIVGILRRSKEDECDGIANTYADYSHRHPAASKRSTV